MQKTFNIKAKVSAVILTVLAMLLPASCNILEDLDPCPRGLRIRFVYDYNMEYANAFHSNVDCFTLYIYDKDGFYLKSITESGEVLKDENYRLDVDLPHGDYQLVAYGGIACEQASFHVVSEPKEGDHLSQLQTALTQEDYHSDKLLHHFYYGSADVTVSGELYNEVSIQLVRNTNNFRVLLQHLNGEAIPTDQFSFCIKDDNSIFDCNNRKVANGTMTYTPWAQGIVSSDPTKAEEGISAGYAEMSTPRLYTENGNRLIIKKIEDDMTVLDVPLNEYLLLLKSDRFAQMGSQEFLDRQSDWSLVFFLDSRFKWINSQIIVNGWVVRLNHMDL